MNMTESGNKLILTGRNRRGPDGVWNMVVTSFQLCLCVTCCPCNLWRCHWTMRSLTRSHFCYRCGGQVLILPMYSTHECAYMHTMVDSLWLFSSRKDIVTELAFCDMSGSELLHFFLTAIYAVWIAVYSLWWRFFIYFIADHVAKDICDVVNWSLDLQQGQFLAADAVARFWLDRRDTHSNLHL